MVPWLDACIHPWMNMCLYACNLIKKLHSHMENSSLATCNAHPRMYISVHTHHWMDGFIHAPPMDGWMGGWVDACAYRQCCTFMKPFSWSDSQLRTEIGFKNHVFCLYGCIVDAYVCTSIGECGHMDASMHIHMGGWMWPHGCINAFTWMGRWMDGWMWVFGRIYVYTWMDGSTWMHKCMYGCAYVDT